MTDDDVLSELDPILAAADTSSNPWTTVATGPLEGQRIYVPDFDLARRLLGIPIGLGYATEQQSGRVAKALDAWIAHEFRRAGFPENSMWPRAKRPRVLPGDLAPLEAAIRNVHNRLNELEDRLDRYAQKAVKKGLKAKRPSLRGVTGAVNSLSKVLPGRSSSEILGEHYVKQVDVVNSTWQRGPDILISTKTQFSSYLNNKNNRYEEALGEGTNLRHRYPFAAMGFAHFVRTNIYDETGAFDYLRNQLARLRKPDGPFHATMLIAGDWDATALDLTSVEDTAEQLSAARFFSDIVHAIITSSGPDLHRDVRFRKQGEPKGGLPPVEGAVASDETVELDPALVDDPLEDS
jgi:hypothetical protein